MQLGEEFDHETQGWAQNLVIKRGFLDPDMPERISSEHILEQTLDFMEETESKLNDVIYNLPAWSNFPFKFTGLLRNVRYNLDTKNAEVADFLNADPVLVNREIQVLYWDHVCMSRSSPREKKKLQNVWVDLIKYKVGGRKRMEPLPRAVGLWLYDRQVEQILKPQETVEDFKGYYENDERLTESYSNDDSLYAKLRNTKKCIENMDLLPMS